jgi:hypothetical protein
MVFYKLSKPFLGPFMAGGVAISMSVLDIVSLQVLTAVRSLGVRNHQNAATSPLNDNRGQPRGVSTARNATPAADGNRRFSAAEPDDGSALARSLFAANLFWSGFGHG